MKLTLKTHRELDKRYKLEKSYVVTFEKDKNKHLMFQIPNDIIKAFHIEEGDVAVFEVISKKEFIVRFVKNTMFSFVRGLKI